MCIEQAACDIANGKYTTYVCFHLFIDRDLSLRSFLNPCCFETNSIRIERSAYRDE